MDTNQLIKHFGGREAAIKALHVYRQLWEYWEKVGIPVGRQWEIQAITMGKLKATKRKR